MSTPNATTRNLLLGALLGGGLALLVFGLWYLAANLDYGGPGDATGESPDPSSYLFIIIPVFVGTLCGAIMGFAAAKFETARLPKLFGTAAGLYLFAAWAVGAALVIGTMIAEGGVDPAGEGVFLDSLKIGFIGAIFMSPFCVPLIFGLVLVLERLTRKT